MMRSASLRGVLGQASYRASSSGSSFTSPSPVVAAFAGDLTSLLPCAAPAAAPSPSPSSPFPYSSSFSSSSSSLSSFNAWAVRGLSTAASSLPAPSAHLSPQDQEGIRALVSFLQSDAAGSIEGLHGTGLGGSAVAAGPAAGAGGSDAAAPGGTTASGSAGPVPKESPATQSLDSAPLMPVSVPVVSLKPKEVVSELDKYIIGQTEAKKAIAIAVRNRWRRLRLPLDLQQEVIPKNILMVGPTGVGKTEIARRLAKLANAPFVKVEATKFTEVGYHGRDVDTIIRDLLEASLLLVRKLKTEQFRSEVRPLVEKRILDAITGPDAREDTVESFRRLLLSGDMDDRQISIMVPVKPANSQDFEMSVQGATIDLSEIMSRFGPSKTSPRMESKKLKVKECWSILEEHELEAKLSTLDVRKEAVELAEQSGIVFIDEIDKIVSDRRKYSSDASSEGVQRDLLPLIEGCSVDVKRFGPVRTDYILFVASGAFHESKPADMLAELQGRLPIRVELNPLSVEDLKRILVEPEANLLMQQKALIGAEDVNVEFTDDAIEQISKMAYDINTTVENIGARRLHTIVERIMEDISFNAPEMDEGSVVVVDKDLVDEKIKPMLKKQDLSKFIL